MRNLDLVQRFELERRAEAATVWAICKDSRLVADPLEEFERRGFSYLRTKAAVDPMLASDAAVASQAMNAALVKAVDRQSAMLSLDGLVVVPVTAANSTCVMVSTFSASTVNEGAPKPVSRLDLQAAGDTCPLASACHSFT